MKLQRKIYISQDSNDSRRDEITTTREWKEKGKQVGESIS